MIHIVTLFSLCISDPLVVSIVQDIFKELSKNASCIVPLQTRLVPTLISILQSPADKVPMGLQAVSFFMNFLLSVTEFPFASTLKWVQSTLLNMKIIRENFV